MQKIIKKSSELSREIKLLVDPINFEVVELNEAAKDFLSSFGNDKNKFYLTDFLSAEKQRNQLKKYSLANNNHTLKFKSVRIPGVGKKGKLVDLKIAASFQGRKKLFECIITGQHKKNNKNISSSLGHSPTDQANNLKKLDKIELKFKSLFELANDSIFLMDAEIFIDCNKKTLEIFGCVKEDIIGKPPYDFSPEKQPDGRLSKEKAFEKINAVLTGIPQRFEWKHKKLNGELFDAEVSLNRIKLGEDILIQAIVRDITDRKIAEEQISMLAHALKSIFESVCITDMMDNIIFINNSFCNTFGYKNDEIIGKHISIIRAERNPGNILNQILPATLKGGWSGEVISVKKDGTEFPASVSTSVIRNDDGKPIALINVAIDITNRKLAEKALKQREKFLSALNDSAQMLLRSTSEIDYQKYVDIIGPASGASRTYIFLNHTDEKGALLTSQVAEWCDKEIKPQIDNPELQNFPFSSRFPRWTKILSEGGVISGKVSEFPDEERAVLEPQQIKVILIFPLNTKQGFIGFIGFDNCVSHLEWEDVELNYLSSATHNLSQSTDRIHGDRALRESEERFRSLVDNMIEAALIIDWDGEIIFANNSAARLVALEEPGQGVGKKVFEFLHPDFTSKASEALVLLRKNPAPFIDEYLIKTVNNEDKWVESLGTKIMFANKNYILVTLRDVTERKNTERQLKIAKEQAEELSKIKSNFLANISHELRTPLVGILGFAELLKEKLKEKHTLEMADRILTSAGRLMDTLNLLLDLSRIEAKKVDINLYPNRISELVESQILLFEAVAERKNLFLETKIIDHNLFAIVDEQIFRQIINNLVNNALKYTYSGGVNVLVDSFTENSNTYVRINVRDTGIGIPEESLGLIFQEFRQVSEGFNRHFEGTGLGLTITKNFVEMMDGQIRVKSTVGSGSTFTVLFPLLKDYKQLEIQKVSKVDDEKIIEKDFIPGFRPSLLVVDNDESSRDIIKLFVKDICDTDFADSGEKAFRLINEKKYDIILMDINLGKGMSGVETTKEIRKIESYKSVPIIAITGFAMRGDREEFIQAGCTHYLSKPFSRAKIMKLISEIASKKDD